ncbi:Serine/threonine protein kinase [Handroanthus impetiginosus]|uniref:non-specific serine/threonine protein kinase n=1 Tax=Handroanthus impetiginosus TaxID=429701 RepID=A0A2G9HG50_9LAMI|nr:Serine/threonine protein kinase [Handroanthus impetiginosus]
MNPKPDSFLLLLILMTLVTMCVSQINQWHQTCGQTLLRCGSMREIGYPFWGGDRPAFCGYPGFKLDCQNYQVFRINISSMVYRVLDINNTTQTLRVARDDLWNNVCPTVFTNTTLNFTIFDYSSTANDENITLHYGCSFNQMVPAVSPYYFNCSANGPNNWNFFLTRESSQEISWFGNGTTCDTVISVPVNLMAARALATPTMTSMNLLQESLNKGFSIQWFAINDNCNPCVQSGGVCGYNQESGSFSCYCRDQTHDLTCDENRIGNGVSIGIAGIVVSSIVIFYIRKRSRLRKVNKESNHIVNKFLLAHGSLAPKRYNYHQIKKITKSFTDKLGQGGYGIVYKGKLPDGQLVAVKVLTETDENGEEFVNEVASISRTSHVNIVNLLGFCYERKKRALVYEYMPNKSLDKFIRKSGSLGPDAYLEWEKLFDIAVGVARGCNTRIVHFDIKPQNILLDQDFCPKISDFGLAKLFKKKQSIISMLGTRGTIGYIAPEVFSRSFGGVSHKSDFYSYGMMLLEIAGARKNIEIEAIQSSEDYFPDKIYEHVLLKNKKLGDLITEENEETARKMLLVGFWCIQTAPSERPSMTKVVEMLEGSLQSMQIPPKPVLSSPRLLGQQFSSSFSVIVEAENSN